MLIDTVKGIKAEKALEIGCGCGLISLVLGLNCTEVFAIDVSKQACENTLENLKSNKVNGMIHVVNSDLTTAFRKGVMFDLIASNPPYLPVEPSVGEDVSWAAGEDNSFSKRLLEETLTHLSEKGVMLLVQSSLSDLSSLKRLVEGKGFAIEEVSIKEFFFEKIIVFKISRLSHA